ncbi:hypothetical protein HOK021_35370 [Streptomyces hygroscopicus]|nr:hypothetical protein HOK021_35370 [Streptomyces hygroscopicus]
MPPTTKMHRIDTNMECTDGQSITTVRGDRYQCRWTPRSCRFTDTRPGPAVRAPAGDPADHAIGRSRGGLTTKIRLAEHAPATDARRLPLAFVLAVGRPATHPLSRT